MGQGFADAFTINFEFLPLPGRDKVASLWLALTLWAVAAVSESRLVSQPALLISGWVALFALPPAYSMCR